MAKMPMVKISSNIYDLIDLLETAKNVLQRINDFELEVKAEIIKEGEQ